MLNWIKRCVLCVCVCVHACDYVCTHCVCMYVCALVHKRMSILTFEGLSITFDASANVILLIFVIL